jgi:chemotaxis protein histidine kinase CheA
MITQAMDSPSASLVEILLTASRTVALQLNERLSVRIVHNAPLLAEWRGHGGQLAASLRALLEELLPQTRAREILTKVELAALANEESFTDLGVVMLHGPRGGGAAPHVSLGLHRVADGGEFPLLLTLRDVSTRAGLQQVLAQTQDSLDTALTALRSSPQTIRMFLVSAMTAVSALRATMKTPAREQEALRAKLTRLADGIEQLATEAVKVGLVTIVAACRALAERVEVLHQQQQVSGDELLPLAPLIDRIASAVGNASRIEEQRYSPPPQQARATATRATSSQARQKQADEWAQQTERRWNGFLRQRGEELGTLVKLHVDQAQLVPEPLRRGVDDMLQHLLRNAVEHGIETPEERLAADKPAAGQITVKFEDHGNAGIAMTVRDDGRGFNVERIGRAAVRSGIVSEESLVERDPGQVVGLIFKPNFTTENLAGEAGRGRGMSFLRRTVTRLGGQISVATKPGRYTQFVIQLPAGNAGMSEAAKESGAA